MLVITLLDEAKQQGLIRASGMSTKTVDGGLLTLQHSDVAMITINPDYTTEVPVAEEAARSNKGILIKKALGSGHLPADQSIKFSLEKPGVSSIVVGTINPDHLQNNLRSV